MTVKDPKQFLLSKSNTLLISIPLHHISNKYICHAHCPQKWRDASGTFSVTTWWQITSCRHVLSVWHAPSNLTCCKNVVFVILNSVSDYICLRNVFTLLKQAFENGALKSVFFDISTKWNTLVHLCGSENISRLYDSRKRLGITIIP